MRSSMNDIVFHVIDSPEGGFEARALGADIFTEADTMEELHEAIRDAVACHFDSKDRPTTIRLTYTRTDVIAA